MALGRSRSEFDELMLTGTPAGVMCHFLNIWSPLAYLGDNDEVVAFADHLGVLRNRIGQAERSVQDNR
jgi:2-keto-4-pentenoate hydratase/2-oxohepta-3-ene-1,7-dioic acid hydratase in catechol pathway